jgi:hypothetical protein
MLPMQAGYAISIGSYAVTNCLRFDTIRETIVMLCNDMEYERKPVPAIPHRGFAKPRCLASSTADRIRAFLDGKTHGEEVLHELYDHILDEPIPQRMRALFEK